MSPQLIDALTTFIPAAKDAGTAGQLVSLDEMNVLNEKLGNILPRGLLKC